MDAPDRRPPRPMPRLATLATELMLPALRAVDQLPAGPRQRATADSRAILSAAGISDEQLLQPTARLPHDVALRLLEAALVASGDRSFALRAGMGTRRDDLGVFAAVTVTAPDLGAAIQLGVHCSPLLHDGSDYDMICKNGMAHWTHSFRPELRTSAAANEYVVAVCYAMSRHYLGTDLPLREVHFAHAEPTHHSLCEHLLSTPARFRQSKNALVFDQQALSAQLPSADRAIHRVVKRYANELLARQPRLQPFTARVDGIVRSQLARTARLSAIADAMFMSESTVQRRLQAEGTSHSEILERVRRELSIELLETTDLTISEIAFQLGFAHRPAFHRAFRRWFRMSPSEHRAGTAQDALPRLLRG